MVDDNLRLAQVHILNNFLLAAGITGTFVGIDQCSVGIQDIQLNGSGNIFRQVVVDDDCRRRVIRHPVVALPAINLGNDVAMLTAIGNDVGFDEVFQRQVIAQGTTGDALFGISTSGNSANLIAAFEVARERGLICIALLGGDGGRIRDALTLDHCLVVSTNNIHRIQETHVACYHILWDLVHTLMAAQR